MLQQILSNTPLWVWALLAFLVYRGLIASADREVGLKKLFILPLAMLALSLQGIATSFGADPSALPTWLGGVTAGALLAWMLFDAGSIGVRPDRNTVALRGSWLPLALMLAIFCTKYAVGVSLAINPDLKQQAVFVASICALYGLFSGVFFGRLLRVVAIYRQGVARMHKLL